MLAERWTEAVEELVRALHLVGSQSTGTIITGTGTRDTAAMIVDTLYLLGQAHVALGDVERARTAWVEALRGDPSHRGARLQLDRISGKR